MTTPALSHRDRSALTNGAVILALLVGLFRGVPALLRLTEQARAVAVAARAEAARAAFDASQHLLRAVALSAASGAVDSVAGRLLSAPGTSSLVAQSSQEVSELAASFSVLMQDIRTLAVDSSRSPLRVVRLHLAGEGDVQGLVALLAALETGTLMGDVRRLRIDAPEPSAPADRPERLRFEAQVDVVGWVGGRAK